MLDFENIFNFRLNHCNLTCYYYIQIKKVNSSYINPLLCSPSFNITIKIYKKNLFYCISHVSNYVKQRLLQISIKACSTHEISS